jgi:hypothetical protein
VNTGFLHPATHPPLSIVPEGTVEKIRVNIRCGDATHRGGMPTGKACVWGLQARNY